MPLGNLKRLKYYFFKKAHVMATCYRPQIGHSCPCIPLASLWNSFRHVGEFMLVSQCLSYWLNWDSSSDVWYWHIKGISLLLMYLCLLNINNFSIFVLLLPNSFHISYNHLQDGSKIIIPISQPQTILGYILISVKSLIM